MFSPNHLGLSGTDQGCAKPNLDSAGFVRPLLTWFWTSLVQTDDGIVGLTEIECEKDRGKVPTPRKDCQAHLIPMEIIKSQKGYLAICGMYNMVTI